MQKNLIDNILAEPGTGAALLLQASQMNGERVETGELVSSATGRRFPIVRGIPRFVQSDTSADYTDSFGKQWNRFRSVQLDSATGGSVSQQRFDSETGWRAPHLQGQRLLDAGCGAGRFAEIAAGRGAHLLALDYSAAVEAAAQTLSRFPDANVVQGDLLMPPFRPGAFDLAYCIGVAQHTPCPAAAVDNVVASVRRHGKFSLTIYARKLWTRLNGKYLARRLTRHLSPQTLLMAIEATMPILFPLTDRLFRVPKLGKLARFAIPVANYVDRPDFTDAQRYQEAVLDTFDMLAPVYDSPMTWREVEAVLRGAGAQQWEFRSRVPINVSGVR